MSDDLSAQRCKENELTQAPPPRESAAVAVPRPKRSSLSVPGFDYTRLDVKDAGFFASMVVDELRTAIPALAPQFQSQAMLSCAGFTATLFAPSIAVQRFEVEKLIAVSQSIAALRRIT